MVRGLHEALERYLRVRRTLVCGADPGALLLSRYGRRLTVPAVEKLMQKLSQQPGRRRLHPHLFRHSIAVHLLRNGADIRYLQAFLGHELLDTTKIYLRLVPADIREAYDKAMPEMPLRE
jgi:site-specific recombinase XerD